MSKPYPANILPIMRTAASAWQAIDPDLKVGELSLEEMQATLAEGEDLRRRINDLELQLTSLRNQRDDNHTTGWNYIIRLRDAIAGQYGDDSSEYEMVGRKRRSERKPRSKRVAAPKTESTPGAE